MGTLIICPDEAAFARRGAELITGLLVAAVAARGRGRVALAGGRTPAAVYRALAGEPFRTAVPWARVEFFWGDERWVPAEHRESNFRMVRECLLDHVPVPAENVHPVPVHSATPEGAAAAYEAELRRAFGAAVEVPRFDVVLLGLGADGHTASLFPGTAALLEEERFVVATFVPAVGGHRITLTLPVLNNAAHVLFLVAGAEKGTALRAVTGEGVAERGAEVWPARLVRPRAGALTWLVDQAAWNGSAG